MTVWKGDEEVDAICQREIARFGLYTSTSALRPIVLRKSAAQLFGLLQGIGRARVYLLSGRHWGGQVWIEPRASYGESGQSPRAYSRMLPSRCSPRKAQMATIDGAMAAWPAVTRKVRGKPRK
jgi:hypothetical protein